MSVIIDFETRSKKEFSSFNYEVGDQIAWRSGRNFYCGKVFAWVDAKRSIRAVRDVQDLIKTLPKHRLHLGRDKTTEDRVIIEVTHKLSNNSWKPYQYTKFSSFTLSRFNPNIKDVRSKIEPIKNVIEL